MGSPVRQTKLINSSPALKKITNDLEDETNLNLYKKIYIQKYNYNLAYLFLKNDTFSWVNIQNKNIFIFSLSQTFITQPFLCNHSYNIEWQIYVQKKVLDFYYRFILSVLSIAIEYNTVFHAIVAKQKLIMTMKG